MSLYLEHIKQYKEQRLERVHDTFLHWRYRIPYFLLVIECCVILKGQELALERTQTRTLLYLYARLSILSSIRTKMQLQKKILVEVDFAHIRAFKMGDEYSSTLVCWITIECHKYACRKWFKYAQLVYLQWLRLAIISIEHIYSIIVPHLHILCSSSRLPLPISVTVKCKC